MKAIKSLLAGALTCVSAAAFAQSQLDVTVLHINDHHSHLQGDGLGLDVSALNLSTTLTDGSPVQEVEVSYGGFPLLISAMDRMASRVSNPIKIHAGDAITGTLFYTLFEGEADAALMNEVCFDVFALGNHEFDDGDAGLANFLDYLRSGSCDTPVLAANVVPGPMSALNNDDYLESYVIMEVEGQEIGIIGIDIAQKTKESSNPDDNTEFLDELETAQSNIDELTAMGVNKIILVTHYQYANDIALANNLSGVDVIVGGDSHTLLGSQTLSDYGFPVGGEYPTLETDLNGNTVCIVQAWEYSHLFGRLRVRFNELGEVEFCRGNPIVPLDVDGVAFEDSSGDTMKLSGEDRRTVLKALVSNPEFQVATPDAAATSLIEGFNSEVAELEQSVIGEVASDLCLERWPGQARSTLCDRSATYQMGSDISNIVAKAFLTVSPTADIGIQNGGGVRVDVAAGEFTIADAFTLLPFSNTLVILDMTGQQIIDVLEDALANTLDAGGSSGSYPYASGLRYHVDASAEFGGRVSNVEVNPQVAGDWVAIDPDTTYRVVTNDFIASGQDGYNTFGTVFDAGLVEDTFVEYAQGFIDYVEGLTDMGESVDLLPESEYSTQYYIGSDGCDHMQDDTCEGF